MPSIVIEATWAARRRHRDHLLAALLSVPRELYDAAEVDGASIWQKIWHVTLPQLRGILFITLILQLIATVAALHRAVPVHRRRAGQLDYDRAAADLPLRLPEQPGRRLRHGRRAEHDAGRLPRPCSPPSTSGSTTVAGATHHDSRDSWPDSRAGATGQRSAESSPSADCAQPAGPLVAAVHQRHDPGPRSLIVGLGPLLWLAKSAITPTQDTLRKPMALWPHGFDLGIPRDRPGPRPTSTATSSTPSGSRSGSWIVQIVVATTGGYVLSVLRPRFHRILTALVLATLFVPSIVLLVPLYLTDRQRAGSCTSR